METINNIWSEKLKINNEYDKAQEQQEIVEFIYKELVGHSIDIKKVEFMGVVYGSHLVSVRVPGLLELAFGIIHAHRKEKNILLPKKRRKNLLLMIPFFDKWRAYLRSIFGSDNGKYVRSSVQRLHLVDERKTGLKKMANAFKSFKVKRGIICWYGEKEFEISLVSNK